MELGRECLEIWGYKRVDELIWVKTNQLQRLIRTGRTGHWLNQCARLCIPMACHLRTTVQLLPCIRDEDVSATVIIQNRGSCPILPVHVVCTLQGMVAVGTVAGHVDV